MATALVLLSVAVSINIAMPCGADPSSIETSLSFELPTMVETIFIYDMSGSLLQTIKGGFIDDAGSPLNVQELPAGVYIVIVRDIDGNEYSQKLLVNNR